MNQGKKILIVDDEQSVQNLLEKVFLHKGFKVYCAGNSLQGIDICKKENPDVIILDLSVSGFELMRELRKTERGMLLPVIILTNMTINDEILYDIHFYKPSYCLMKSECSTEVLLQKVYDVLQIAIE